MGNSLNFVKNRIVNKDVCSLNIKDYTNAYEFGFTDFIQSCSPVIQKLYFDNCLSTTLCGDYNGISGSLKNNIAYVPDAEFEYFTVASCRCDGTSIFLSELMEEILNKLLGIKTYNNETIPEGVYSNIWAYDINYTVGNFVLNEEFGDFGTADKPWMQSRFTAILPIKCEWIKKELTNESV